MIAGMRPEPSAPPELRDPADPQDSGGPGEPVDPHDAHDPRAERRPWLGLLAGLAGLLLLALAARLAADRDPLRAAWRAASRAESYRVEGRSEARAEGLTLSYRIAGEGRRGGALLLEMLPEVAGTAEASAEPVDGPVDMEAELKSPAADPPDPTLGLLRLRLQWPEASESREEVSDAGFTEGENPSVGTGTAETPRAGASDEAIEGRRLEPHALAGLLPAGDPLALLAVAHAPRIGPIEAVDGRDCRRIDFRVGGRAYGAWWRAHPAYWPVNADSGGMETFSAEGSLWASPGSMLPCRIAVRIELPRLAGERPGQGRMDWRYQDWSGSDR
jgi:hypothetical protein